MGFVWPNICKLTNHTFKTSIEAHRKRNTINNMHLAKKLNVLRFFWHSYYFPPKRVKSLTTTHVLWISVVYSVLISIQTLLQWCLNIQSNSIIAITVITNSRLQRTNLILLLGPKWQFYYTNFHSYNDVTAITNRSPWSRRVRYNRVWLYTVLH